MRCASALGAGSHLHHVQLVARAGAGSGRAQRVGGGGETHVADEPVGGVAQSVGLGILGCGGDLALPRG